MRSDLRRASGWFANAAERWERNVGSGLDLGLDSGLTGAGGLRRDSSRNGGRSVMIDSATRGRWA